MEKLYRLPVEEVVDALKDSKYASMREVMQALRLNPRSSSTSTKLRSIAHAYSIDTSRFSSGRRDNNLAGRVYGSLMVIELVPRIKSGCLTWRCKCRCGKEVMAATAVLNSGQRSHCGCESYPSGDQSRVWSGYGEISGHLWSQFKSNAARRKISFSVGIDQAWDLFLKSGKRCALSGVSIGFSRKRSTASLDRIDSALGYAPENIQWVHKVVNVMKWSLSTKEFLDWIERISKYAGNASGGGTRS